MSYDENRINDQIEGGMHARDELTKAYISSSLAFAEWMDINCIRSNAHEWTYKKEMFSKRHSTNEMFEEWQNITKD